MGSRVTPQPRTSAAVPGVVGRTTMHQLPKSTPTEASGALYAESLLWSAWQRSSVSQVTTPKGDGSTKRSPLTTSTPAPRICAASCQATHRPATDARAFQDQIARHPAADDGGVGEQMRIEHLVSRPGLQRERRGGELGQRRRSEALCRIELLDDTVVAIEVYGGGGYERAALLQSMEGVPLRVGRKRREGGGGKEQK